jgi:cytochrome d ubiquinol oxidase subunit I
MGPAGLVAILAGWITTEVGRQPWVVYGLLRTADAASTHTVEQMAFTLGLFIVVYFLVFGAGTVYLLRIIGDGPTAGEGDHPVSGGPGEPRQPMRPLSGAPDNLPVV